MTQINIVLAEDQREGTVATVSQWLIKEGEYIEKDQPIVELETDKVMMEIVAPISGVLSAINLQTGDEIKDAMVLGVIDSSLSASNEIQPNKENLAKTDVPELVEKDQTTTISSKNNHKTSPSVRRLIKQHGINIAEIQGTGIENRVTSRDIATFIKNSNNNEPVTTIQTNTISSQRIAINSMRKSIAKHMVHSLLHTAPHVTSVFNLDLSKIIAHRKLNKQKFLDQGVKLTITAYFIAASAQAIKAQPMINSQLHENEIEIFNNINIGIGTALEDEGLIVPVIKNCENKDLLTIADNLTQLTNKARNHKLSPNDVKDGTFTISNHGVSGSLIATPIIINQPQSAILGIGKMEKRVVVKTIDDQDSISIKPMCYVSLTIDHRVLDAHQCNQFLSVFVETIENWR